MTTNADKTVSGHIGFAKFEHAILRYNQGIVPVSWSGIIHIVSCGELGKFFEDDPLETKRIEIWVCPIKKRSNYGGRNSIQQLSNGRVYL